jgi:Mpv17 / PMP22 family
MISSSSHHRHHPPRKAISTCYLALLLLVLLGRPEHCSVRAFSPSPSSSANEKSSRGATTVARRVRTTATKRAAFSVPHAVESFYQNSPYLSAFVTCSVKASAADFFAQTKHLEASAELEEHVVVGAAAAKERARSDRTPFSSHHHHVDVSRNVAFLLYGGLYQGMAQQWMYNTLYPAWFGSHLHDWQVLATQVAFDMIVIGPFLCLPTAYAVKSLFTARNLGVETVVDVIADGLNKYTNDAVEHNLVFKYWALWTPVQFLTFGVVPEHYRVAFVAAISFFWVFLLSSTSSSCNDGQEAQTTTTTRRIRVPRQRTTPT